MRINIIIIGVVILVVGYLLDYVGISPFLFLFAGPIGLLNVVLGTVTPKNPGVTVPLDQSSIIKLSVDKGVVGANTYELFFLQSKLILKKLSSRNLTVVAPLILTLFGLLFVGNLIGAVMFGVTGFSLQEYVTQRRRDKIKRQELPTTALKGDLEFPYNQLNKIEIARNRISLLASDRTVKISIPRRYSDKIRPVLQNIVSSKFVDS